MPDFFLRGQTEIDASGVRRAVAALKRALENISLDITDIRGEFSELNTPLRLRNVLMTGTILRWLRYPTDVDINARITRVMLADDAPLDLEARLTRLIIGDDAPIDLEARVTRLILGDDAPLDLEARVTRLILGDDAPLDIDARIRRFIGEPNEPADIDARIRRFIDTPTAPVDVSARITRFVGAPDSIDVRLRTRGGEPGGSAFGEGELGGDIGGDFGGGLGAAGGLLAGTSIGQGIANFLKRNPLLLAGLSVAGAVTAATLAVGAFAVNNISQRERRGLPLQQQIRGAGISQDAYQRLVDSIISNGVDLGLSPTELIQAASASAAFFDASDFGSIGDTAIAAGRLRQAYGFDREQTADIAFGLARIQRASGVSPIESAGLAAGLTRYGTPLEEALELIPEVLARSNTADGDIGTVLSLIAGNIRAGIPPSEAGASVEGLYEDLAAGTGLATLIEEVFGATFQDLGQTLDRVLVDLERQVGRERVLEEVGAEGVVAISNLLDDPTAFRERAAQLGPSGAAATFAQYTNVFEETVTSSLERLSAAWEQFVDGAVDQLARLITDPGSILPDLEGFGGFGAFGGVGGLGTGGTGGVDAVRERGSVGGVPGFIGGVFDDISGLFTNEQENLETSLSGYSGAIRGATEDIESATSDMNAAIRRATTLTAQVRRQARVLNASVSLGYDVT